MQPLRLEGPMLIISKETAVAAARIARAMLMEHREQFDSIKRDGCPHAPLAEAALIFLEATSQEKVIRGSLG